MSLSSTVQKQTAAGDAPARVARRAGRARSLGRIDVHTDPEAADAAWGALEAACPGAIYQTRRFLRPWLAAFGGPYRMTPMLVVAHDAAGDPVAFLPFGVRREGLFRVAEFVGGKDSNANLGLFRPDIDFSRDDLISLLRAAATKAKRRPDLFRLTNQPEVWDGRPNPLDIFPHQPSASSLHGGALSADFEAFQKARLSRDTLKKLARKRARIEATAPVRHVVAQTPEAAIAILDAFFEQKIARFRQKKIASVLETEEARRFWRAAALDGFETGAPAIEMHALLHGGRFIATYGGGAHNGRFHLMVNSFDTDPAIARSSPGDLLLQSVLEQKAKEGLTGFDLGIGEARYKDNWCDQTLPLFDSLMPVTRRGRLYAWLESARLKAKRRIKQSAWAWPFARRLLRQR